MRWRSWLIPWSNGIVQDWRSITRYKLSVHGWLRRPWILFCWDCNTACMFKGKVPGQSYHFARKSWKQTDYISLRFLWWMPEKVRKCKCLEVSNRLVWLLATHCCRWKSNILFAWRSFTKSWYSWSNPRNWQSCRSSSWGSDVWLTLVGSWW